MIRTSVTPETMRDHFVRFLKKFEELKGEIVADFELEQRVFDFRKNDPFGLMLIITFKSKVKMEIPLDSEKVFPQLYGRGK